MFDYLCCDIKSIETQSNARKYNLVIHPKPRKRRPKFIFLRNKYNKMSPHVKIQRMVRDDDNSCSEYDQMTSPCRLFSVVAWDRERFGSCKAPMLSMTCPIAAGSLIGFNFSINIIIYLSFWRKSFECIWDNIRYFSINILL